MKLRAVAALALCLAVSRPFPVEAIPCELDSFQARFARADWVFKGRVARVLRPNWTAPRGDSMQVLPQSAMTGYVFEPTASWKGDMHGRVTVYSQGVDSACGINFKLGEEYLVMSGAVAGPEWVRWPDGVAFPAQVTATSDGTRKLELAAKDLGRLGPPPWTNPAPQILTPITEAWIVFVQDYASQCREFCDSTSVGTVLHPRSPGMPRLLRPNNWPGKPLPIDGWLKDPGSWARASASHSIGMYAIEIDSCRSETREVVRHTRRGPVPDKVEGRYCVPMVAIFDTTGVLRGAYPNSRDARWSPDGQKLAFRTTRRPIYRSQEATVEYREQPDGVTILAPMTGESWSYPAATEMLSWVDDETLMLELRGRRYGLSSVTGRTGSAMIHAAELTIMSGVVSQDQWYMYRPGTLKIWSLYGRETDIVGAEVDMTGDAPEGIDKDISDKLIGAVGGQPEYIAKGSFWVRDEDRGHLLCLGIGWSGRETRRDRGKSGPRCEVLLIDVHRGIVVRRIEGSLISQAGGGRIAVVWLDGHARFEDLNLP